MVLEGLTSSEISFSAGSPEFNADENDLKRIDKIVEREEQRKKTVKTAERLNTKGVAETFPE